MKSGKMRFSRVLFVVLCVPLFDLLLSSCSTTVKLDEYGYHWDEGGFGCLGQTLKHCAQLTRYRTTVPNYFALLDSGADMKDVNGHDIGAERPAVLKIYGGPGDPRSELTRLDQLTPNTIPKINSILLPSGTIVKYAESNEFVEDSQARPLVGYLFYSNGIIDDIKVKIRSDLFALSTDEDFTLSGLYAAALMAIGKRCDMLSDMHTFYQFFYNKVLPTGNSRRVIADFRTYLRSNETVGRETQFFDVCGTKVKYSHYAGKDSTSQNKRGVFDLNILTFAADESKSALIERAFLSVETKAAN